MSDRSEGIKDAIASQGRGPLVRPAQTHDVVRESETALHNADNDLVLREKRRLYEQAKAHLEQEGAAMLERGAGLFGI